MSDVSHEEQRAQGAPSDEAASPAPDKAIDGPLSRQEASALLARRYMDGPEDDPSAVKPEPADEEQPADDVSETDDDDDAEAQDTPKDDEAQEPEDDQPAAGDEDDDEVIEESDDEAVATEIDDNAVIEVTRDGEKTTASIRDLKRAYGQQAAYQRRSQELTQVRTNLETLHQQQLAGLEIQAQPYAQILQRFQALSPEDQTKTENRQAAQNAHNMLQYFQQTSENFQLQLNDYNAEKTRQLGQQSLPEIMDRVPEWTDQYYDTLRSSMQKHYGVPEADINKVTDPIAWEIMSDAHKFRTAKALKTKPKKRKAKKPVKSMQEPIQTQAADQKGRRAAAVKRLKTIAEEGGNTRKAAADAFSMRYVPDEE